MNHSEYSVDNQSSVSFLYKAVIGIFLMLFCRFGAANAAPNQLPYDVRFVVKNYDHSLSNKLVGRSTAVSKGNQPSTITTQTALWEISTTSKSIVGEYKTVENTIVFRLTKGAEKSAAVAVEFQFADWDKANYVLMPAAVYNGNRFESRRIPYSPKLNDARDIGKDKPTIITDVPRLNISDGPSLIQERSGSMALPSIGFQSVKTKMGFFLTTSQANVYGDYGINIEETSDRQTAIVSLCSPLVRERFKYQICDNQAPSVDLPADFKVGDEVKLVFRVHTFDAPTVQSLFDKYLTIRKDLSPSPEFVPQVPLSTCYTILEKKFNSYNFVPEWGYYSVGGRNMFLQDWQIGWTGGMISTYPLLFSGDESTRRNVIANFDWLFPNGISPSGFFWDSGEKGNKWYGGDIRKPQSKNWHLVRKSADALYYIIKQFELMKLQKITVKPSWEQGTRGVADAFVRLWKNNRQFGQFVDSQTGEIAVGGSTGGGLAPAALVFASKYYNDKTYLQVACESAQQMYDDYIAKGISTGGPGDALQNPDSESLYGILESFAELYEVTGDQKWLTYTAETAAQFSTWVMSYDYQFPKASLFGQMDMKTTGAVFANTQNKHGSPGICTHSGLALLRLYRATGNLKYLTLLQEIAQAIPQYMSRPDRPIKGMQDGWINERVSTTDWYEGIGEIFPGSTWAETDLLLTIIELPGVYVDLDKKTVATFDQLHAEIISCNGKSVKLKITNPTNMSAQTTILAEMSLQKAKPWGENRLYGKRKYTVEPLQSIVVTVNQN
ncbi:MAG: hypothetical protein ACOYOT_11605 [Bacteroidales bacterium]